MSNPIYYFQTLEHLLATQASRIRALKKEIAALEERLKAHIRSAFFFLYIVLVFALGAAYGFDYFMARPIVAFIAGLAGPTLASLAVIIIPAIIETFEVYLGLCIAQTLYRDHTPYLPHGTPGNPSFPAIPMRLLKVASVLILTLQPVAALATFIALQQANPDNLWLNLNLFTFLTVFAVTAHLIVILSGNNLLALVESIRRYFQSRAKNRNERELAICQNQFQASYKEYSSQVTAYNAAGLNNPYTIHLDTLIVDELADRLSPIEIIRLRSPYIP